MVAPIVIHPAVHAGFYVAGAATVAAMMTLCVILVIPGPVPEWAAASMNVTASSCTSIHSEGGKMWRCELDLEYLTAGGQRVAVNGYDTAVHSPVEVGAVLLLYYEIGRPQTVFERPQLAPSYGEYWAGTVIALFLTLIGGVTIGWLLARIRYAVPAPAVRGDALGDAAL